MATNGKAWAHGSATHPARVLRNMNAAIMGQPTGTHTNSATATTRAGSYGVVGDGDMLVTTTGALGYSVAPGRCVLPGTFAAYQGGYTGYNDAAVTGSVGARHATLTRVDYIAYRVRDTDEDATGSEDDGIVVIAGTAGSGAPSVPSTLGSLLILSEVTVPSSAAGTALTFTDRRRKLSAVGAPIVGTVATRPTGVALRTPTYAYDTDTGDTVVYNGATWSVLSRSAAWLSFGLSAVVQSVGILGTVDGRYQQVGKHIDAWLRFTASSAGSAGNNVTFTTTGLPTPRVDTFNAGTMFLGRSGPVNEVAIVKYTTAGVMTFITGGSTNFLGSNPSFAVASGDIFELNLSYETS